MPNHVTNVIEGRREVLHALLSEAGVDFNRVIQQPAREDPVFTASRTDYPDGSFGYGFDGYSPMDWAREHWGTKWNAYEQEIDDAEGRLRFDTAWNHPAPVIEALSRLHPAEPITVRYADEDLGYNLGEYVIRNGEIVHQVEIEPGTDAACEMAAQIKYGKTWAELREEWDDEEPQAL